jgi:hypothetical protein
VLHSRRRMVATLLAAAVVPVLAAGPAHAIGWTLIRTYPGQAACIAAGPAMAAGQQWRCAPSPSVPSAYDLYVLT